MLNRSAEVVVVVTTENTNCRAVNKSKVVVVDVVKIETAEQGIRAK